MKGPFTATLEVGGPFKLDAEPVEIKEPKKPDVAYTIE